MVARTDDQAIQELETLVKATEVTSQALFDIKQQLKTLDAVPSAQSAKLASDFASHEKAFKDLVWKGRDAAGKLESSFKDFSGSVATYLKMSSVTVAKKVTYMGKYEKRGGEMDQQAEALKGSFREWIAEIKAFHSKLQSTTTDLNTKITNDESSLRDLVAQSDKLREQIKQLLVALGIIQNAGQKAASHDGEQKDERFAQLTDLLNKFEDNSYETKRVQKEIESLRSAISLAEKAGTNVAAIPSKTEDVVKATVAFNTLGSIFSADVSAILEKLKAEPFSQDDVNKALDELPAPYKKIVTALYTFQTNVNSAVEKLA